MTSNQKGKLLENKTHQLLTGLGFVVHSTTRSHYKGQDNDIFGLFDHIAVWNLDTPFMFKKETNIS